MQRSIVPWWMIVTSDTMDVAQYKAELQRKIVLAKIPSSRYRDLLLGALVLGRALTVDLDDSFGGNSSFSAGSSRKCLKRSSWLLFPVKT